MKIMNGLKINRIENIENALGAMQAMRELEKYLSTSSIEPNLLHLVKMRVSQINGCAFCLDMHSKDLRAAGETEQRIYLLNAWRETSLYSERERSALEWAEAVTNISNGHVPQEIFEKARQTFSEKELVDLTLAVVAINGWNRISIAFRSEAGSYQPDAFKAVS